MKRLTSTRYAILSVVAIVVLAAAYSAYWFVTANQLAKGLDSWAAARRSEGYKVEWTKETVDGFPFAFRIALTGAAIGRGAPHGYEVDAPVLAGEAAPWNLTHWLLSAPQGAHGTAETYPEPISAVSLNGDVQLGGVFNTVNVTAETIAAGAIHVRQLQVQLMQPRHPPENHQETGLATSIHLAQLTIPKAVKPLGADIASADLSVTFKGALPHGELGPALKAWRDDGGTVDIEQAKLQWGALDLDLSGTIALDDKMQPLAAMSATITNQDTLVDAAVQAGSLPAKNADLVKIVLGLLAKPGPDGRKRLTAPLNIQNEKVFLGPAQIAAVPHVDWE